jgi:phosphatidate cytidylyltransferase
MLKLRLITAFILIPLVLLAVFILPLPYFMGLCTIVSLLTAWEFAPLVGWDKKSWRLLYTAIVLASIVLILSLPSELPVLIGFFLWILIAIGLVIICVKSFVPQIPKWLLGITGVLILLSFWGALVILRMTPWLLLWLFLLVWTADSAAYFGGRLWGKHPLAPLLSPKKTMEGFYCALVIVLLLSLGASYFFPHSNYSVLKCMLTGFITFLAAVIGDLFESFLKRQSNVKDSGQLLPGHGGLFDRIDSLLAAAPVFLICVLSSGLYVFHPGSF